MDIRLSSFGIGVIVVPAGRSLRDVRHVVSGAYTNFGYSVIPPSTNSVVPTT
jgi:hypothetical protein